MTVTYSKPFKIQITQPPPAPPTTFVVYMKFHNVANVLQLKLLSSIIIGIP